MRSVRQVFVGHGLAALLLASIGLLAAASGAGAQYYDRDVDALLPPRAVVWRLSREGFTALSHPRFDGVGYVVDAESPWGNRVRLFVDARSGTIVDRERVEAPLYPPGRVGRPGPGYGWTEEEVVVRAPRVARAAPDAAPTNPFASNYPSRAPTPAEMRAAPPSGLNPEAAGPPREPTEGARRAPRRTARLAAPRVVPPGTPPAKVAPSVPSPAPVGPAAASAVAPAADAKAAQQAATVEPSAPAAVPVAPPAHSPREEPAPAPQRQVRVIGGVTPLQGAPARSEGGAGAPEAPKPAADKPATEKAPGE